MLKPGTRINKFLSEVGYCSRRQADSLIEQGRVYVDRKPAKMGMKVFEDDLIEVDGEKINQIKKKKIFIALNKPKGIVCTTNSDVEENNIIDFVNYHERIFPVGRLDRSTTGLILLTNDGETANQILKTSNNNEKEYLVKVNKPISESILKKMSEGIPMLGKKTRKCSIKKLKTNQFKIILTQGLNRQIRRMCNYFDFKVVSLVRTRIMNIKLDIPEGKYRLLNENEIKSLKNKI
jgi:23S rRNA pseudouridine2604 synthase